MSAKAASMFSAGVLATKFGAIAILTGLAFKQGDASFIGKHPKNFLAECIMVGASAAVPIFAMAYTRRDRTKGLDTSKILTAVMLAFMLFFIFHLMMELSGINNSDTLESNPGDEEQQTYLKKYVLNDYTFTVMLAGAAIMTGLAYKARNNTMFSTDMKTALGEMALFGIVNAIPYYKILKDRKDHEGTTMKAIRMGCLFSFAYAVLECGGFFNHIVGPNHNDHAS